LVLRLLLLEEAYGRSSLALPDNFLINHEDYTLRVGKFANRYSKVMLRSEHMSRFITAETRPWTTPQRFRFFRQYVDHIDNNQPSSATQPFINHQRLVCWPFKYTFTFTPRISERALSQEPSLHTSEIVYRDGKQEDYNAREQVASVK
jgi:hypothetical protein